MWVIQPYLDMHTVSGTSKQGLTRDEALEASNNWAANDMPQ